MQADLGRVLWIPPLGWEVGYFFWGWVSDRAHRVGARPIDVERRLFLLLTVLSLALAFVPHTNSYAGVMLIKFLAMANAAGFIIVAISYATHVYSTNSAGLIAGLGAGAWGAGVAITSPLFGKLFDWKRYDVAYAIASLIPAVGFGLWLWLARSSTSAGPPSQSAWQDDPKITPAPSSNPDQPPAIPR